MDARYRWAELPMWGADENKVLRRKMPQVRVRASAAVFLFCGLAVSLTGCGLRLGAPKATDDADAQVRAAQLKIEDQAWALRSIFFRRRTSDRSGVRSTMPPRSRPSVCRSRTASPPCRAASSIPRRSPPTPARRASPDRIGAFAASNALVTTSPEQAAALYTMATTPEFASCVAKNTVDFRANPPISADGSESLATNITAGESTGSRVSVVYPGRGDRSRSFVAGLHGREGGPARCWPCGSPIRTGRPCRPTKTRSSTRSSPASRRCPSAPHQHRRPAAEPPRPVSLCRGTWRVLRPRPCSGASTGAAPRAGTRPRSRPPRGSRRR